MPSKTMLIKIAAFAGLGTGLVCLIYGLLWDMLPFNKYQGIFWLSFMPLILFFMKERQDRKYLLNMFLSFAVGLVWGLLAIFAIMNLAPLGIIPLDIVIDLVICGLIVFVHKGLLDKTPFNAVACVFLGFAQTLGCMLTSFPVFGELLPPASLNGIDLLIIFGLGTIAAFFVSLLCDALIGKFVFKGNPPAGPEEQNGKSAIQQAGQQ